MSNSTPRGLGNFGGMSIRRGSSRDPPSNQPSPERGDPNTREELPEGCNPITGSPPWRTLEQFAYPGYGSHESTQKSSSEPPSPESSGLDSREESPEGCNPITGSPPWRTLHKKKQPGHHPLGPAPKTRPLVYATGPAEHRAVARSPSPLSLYRGPSSIMPYESGEMRERKEGSSYNPPQRQIREAQAQASLEELAKREKITQQRKGQRDRGAGRKRAAAAGDPNCERPENQKYQIKKPGFASKPTDVRRAELMNMPYSRYKHQEMRKLAALEGDPECLRRENQPFKKRQERSGARRTSNTLGQQTPQLQGPPPQLSSSSYQQSYASQQPRPGPQASPYQSSSTSQQRSTSRQPYELQETSSTSKGKGRETSEERNRRLGESRARGQRRDGVNRAQNPESARQKAQDDHWAGVARAEEEARKREEKARRETARRVEHDRKAAEKAQKDAKKRVEEERKAAEKRARNSSSSSSPGREGSGAGKGSGRAGTGKGKGPTKKTKK